MDMIERKSRRKSRVDIEINEAVDGLYSLGNKRNVKTPTDGTFGIRIHHNNLDQKEMRVVQFDSKPMSFMDKAQLAATAYAKIDMIKDFDKSSKLTGLESLISPEQEVPDSVEGRTQMNPVVIETKHRKTNTSSFDLHSHNLGFKT